MTNKNDINELRNILFDTIRQLKDKDNPLEIERAKAINETAQVIINSAKIEVDHAKVTGAPTTGFIDSGNTQIPKPPGGYVHRIGQRGR